MAAAKRPKPAIIVQARMGSTRLPGKVMREVLGKPLLFFLIERLQRVQNASTLIVATTDHPQDAPIVHFCQEHGILFFQGPEEDVLQRYLLTAKAFHAESVVRITADCPLIDPQIVDAVIEYFLHHAVDYVSNTLIHTFPRGMDTEVFTYQTLEAAATAAVKKSEREHVTLYIYSHPEKFSLHTIENKENESEYRLTVDTEEDFALIKSILETLYPQNPHFSLNEILAMLKRNRSLLNLNRDIVQKKVEE